MELAMKQTEIEKSDKISTYREVKIGKTTYCVTSVFSGEKQLGATLERLAVQKIIDEMNKGIQQILHCQPV